MVEKVSLKVFDADPTHVGRNIVTLDRQTKQALNLTSGDIVEIKGDKTTAAVVWPARAEDEGRSIIRMDSHTRHNAGTSLGENVSVSKAQIKEAKEVVLAPINQTIVGSSNYSRVIKKNFLGRPVVKGDWAWVPFFGRGFDYKIVNTKPSGIVKVNDFTNFILKEKPVKDSSEGVPTVAYEDIGGLKEQVLKVREMVELPMRHPELFTKLGIVPPKGILMYGPPGTGKTLLAKAVANETNAHFISINGPQIMSKFVGEAEERVRKIFKEAEENAPSIIFIDEIDSIAPKRDEVVGEVERRVVAQILSLMDGLEARGNVIVLAATNRVNSIDEALRRPGRFDREIEFGVPDRKGREHVLQIHTRGMPLAKDFNLKDFAAITHGFVGADLEALAKEAAMRALRRYLPEINLDEEKIPEEILESLEVNKSDFEDAMKTVQPSALREVTIQATKTKWDDIGGLEKAKQELKHAVEWPLKNPQAFKKMGISPPKGILLFGPPGCGKTMLAKAVATESEANFINVKGPELLSMYVGESERGVRKIFKKARQVSPVIVFFDELDSMASVRGNKMDSGVGNRVLDQLLTEIDGLEGMKDVVFMAATNRPDMIDSALLRPGRVDKLIRVSIPDKATRKKIFKVHLEGVKHEKKISLDKLAEQTQGLTGADIEGLIREAALNVLQKNKLVPKELTQKDLENAVKKIKPTVSEKSKKTYDNFEESPMDVSPSYVG